MASNFATSDRRDRGAVHLESSQPCVDQRRKHFFDQVSRRVSPYGQTTPRENQRDSLGGGEQLGRHKRFAIVSDPAAKRVAVLDA